MKLSSSQLEAFYAVAKTRSFTKAAQLIHVTQSALSQRVLNLETMIQTTLFIRDRSGVSLTEAGQELLRYCDLQTQFESEFLARLQTNNKGELAGIFRVAGFSTVMRSIVLPSLVRLLKKHANLQVQFQTQETYDLFSMLKSGETDFIILDEKIDRDDIEALYLGSERYVLVDSENGKSPDVYLDHDEFDQTTRRYFKKGRKVVNSFKRHYLDDIYGIIDGVRQGLGKAVVPLHLIENLKGIRVLDPHVTLEIPVYLTYFKQQFYSETHRAVVMTLTRDFPTILDPK